MKRHRGPRLGLAVALCVLGAAIAAFWPFALGAAPAGAPVLDKPRSAPCVRDPQLMRRIHMDLLRHTRDETVHRGVRDAPASLTACVDCHANAQDGRVLGSPSHFCQGCHAYAAVKIDCFECHTSRAAEPVRAASGAKGPS